MTDHISICANTEREWWRDVRKVLIVSDSELDRKGWKNTLTAFLQEARCDEPEFVTKSCYRCFKQWLEMDDSVDMILMDNMIPFEAQDRLHQEAGAVQFWIDLGSPKGLTWLKILREESGFSGPVVLLSRPSSSRDLGTIPKNLVENARWLPLPVSLPSVIELIHEIDETATTFRAGQMVRDLRKAGNESKVCVISQVDQGIDHDEIHTWVRVLEPAGVESMLNGHGEEPTDTPSLPVQIGIFSENQSWIKAFQQVLALFGVRVFEPEQTEDREMGLSIGAHILAHSLPEILQKVLHAIRRLTGKNLDPSEIDEVEETCRQSLDQLKTKKGGDYGAFVGLICLFLERILGELSHIRSTFPSSTAKTSLMLLQSYLRKIEIMSREHKVFLAVQKTDWRKVSVSISRHNINRISGWLNSWLGQIRKKSSARQIAIIIENMEDVLFNSCDAVFTEYGNYDATNQHYCRDLLLSFAKITDSLQEIRLSQAEKTEVGEKVMERLENFQQIMRAEFDRLAIS
jgi:hypothetical protein